MPAIPTQPPDPSTGVRYAKAFKYAFVMLDPSVPVDLTQISPNGSDSVTGFINDTFGFVTLTLPQQISLREPYATAVTVMMDGGKVIESKGHVLKHGTISGTTGFLPFATNASSQIKPSQGALIPSNSDIDFVLGTLSGYLDFMNLRYLFRTFGEQRRAGNLGIQLHFFDYKNDDFWRIEADSFDMTRSSRKPMSYDYNIPFKCIEYSELSVAPIDDYDYSLTNLQQGSSAGLAYPFGLGDIANPFSRQAFLPTTNRFSELSSAALSAINYCDTVVQRGLQIAISKLDDVVGVFQAADDVFKAQLAGVPALMAQLSAALDNMINTASELSPDNVKQELNAWYLEVKHLADNMNVQVVKLVGSQPQRDVTDTDTSFSTTRMKQGATTDLMQEPAGSQGSLSANPFIGSSGLSLITDASKLASGTQHTTVIINTGEDIYALARRVFGSISRFVDLILINRLEFPFIVADVGRKPPNTLAWGESILVPSSVTSTTTTSITGSVDPTVVPTAGGTVSTSSLPSQLIDTNANWLPDQWIGYSVTATTGGISQLLIATGNTATQLTLNSNWTITIVPGITTYSITYNTFYPRRPITPEARAYGTDILMVFDSDGRGDAVLGSNGDLAIATGNDNLIQAITLRARCPIGEHPFHRNYGIPAPVGRPGVDDVFALSTFFIRRSLLADPRVGKVRNMNYTQVGDTLTLNAEVQPIDSRIARPISIQVGT
jgi:hypothetical protein